MAEPANTAELLCRACTLPHYGEKVDILGTPTLTDLYIRLSASHVDAKDSLPKQICATCYHRLDDFNRFQVMCAESYNILSSQFPKIVDLKQEVSFVPVIKVEKSEYLVTEPLPELSQEIINFNSDNENDDNDHDHDDGLGADDSDDDDDEEYDIKKDTDYDPLKDDREYSVGEFDGKSDADVKPNLDSDDEILSEKVKRKRGRKRKKNLEEDPGDFVKVEHDDEEDATTEEKMDGEEIGEGGAKMEKRRKRRSEGESAVKIKSEPYACSQCPRKFYKKERYEGHIRQHEGLKPYACPHCHKQYSKALRLKNHITNEHSENPMRFNCTFEGCDKVYRNRESLNWHINTHFNPPKPVDKADRPVFICELCGKALSSRGVLRKHTMIHTNEYPFVCDICPRKYRTQDRLNLHKMRHKGIKNHECPICGLKKTTGHELNVHMNVHTRAKKFPCNLCNACFLNNGNLVRHVRVVHEGIKTYNCTYCDQSFGKAETLKHHVMRHTGEKPHECPICGKRFIQKTSFQLHVKRHEKAKNGEKVRALRPVVPPPPPLPPSIMTSLAAPLSIPLPPPLPPSIPPPITSPLSLSTVPSQIENNEQPNSFITL